MSTYTYFQHNDLIIKIGITTNKVSSINIVSQISREHKSNELANQTFIQLQEYFNGTRKEFTIPLLIQGTPFQQSVYKELLKIPYGQTISYQQLAVNINHPKAYRAVGNANNKNSIQIIIPCHRVIKNNGSIGGYAIGETIKERLLSLETKNKF